jgi:class 3 adenylate cyclase
VFACVILPGVHARLTGRIRGWFLIASERSVSRRALLTSVAVGLILTAINHWADLRGGGLRLALWWKIALTFLVPYIVSTVSSVSAISNQRARYVHEHGLLEREIEAINRFPDQNPNPVMRVLNDGRLMYANRASEPIVARFGAAIDRELPKEILGQLTEAAVASPSRVVDVTCGLQTFALLPVAVPDLGFMNVYGTDVTAAKVVDKFPDRNPNPVLRMSEDGVLVYANTASASIVSVLGIELGDPLPVEVLGGLRSALLRDDADPVEVRGGGRTFLMRPVAIAEFGFVNIYGTDVTAAKAITKFPDQNPNPVLRVSHEGAFLYANPAAKPVVKALGVDVGDELPVAFFRQIQSVVESGSTDTIEVECDERLFALLAVSVFEFGFINVYGTDITAAREVEIAHRENERLLLNILPPSIARRLREGESTIADHFDAMTVLFADVVDFTRLSERLQPADLVQLLNEVFSIFDGLADRFELEKIKTIGDAYMVVGGLTDHSTDHAERVADMGLEMISQVEAYRGTWTDDLNVRVGMHSGPAVAGVIGVKKFIYDVWGDTVNMASRMESHGVPGRLQVSRATYERLKGRYRFEPRGEVEIKGKGPMPTYLLTSKRPGG